MAIVEKLLRLCLRRVERVSLLGDGFLVVSSKLSKRFKFVAAVDTESTSFELLQLR
jgi:hypothetical protein